MKKEFDGETLAFLILCSLPKTQEWKNIISNIVQSQPASSPLTVQIVEAQLLQIEHLQHGQDNNSALTAICGKQTQNSTPMNSPSQHKTQSQNSHKSIHN